MSDVFFLLLRHRYFYYIHNTFKSLFIYHPKIYEYESAKNAGTCTQNFSNYLLPAFPPDFRFFFSLLLGLFLPGLLPPPPLIFAFLASLFAARSSLLVLAVFTIAVFFFKFLLVQSFDSTACFAFNFLACS